MLVIGDGPLKYCFVTFLLGYLLQGLDQLQQISKQLEADMKKTEEERNKLLNMTHSKYEVVRSQPKKCLSQGGEHNLIHIPEGG